MEGLCMSKKRETKVASDGGPELTSAGVPWSDVPEFARVHVAWIDGRHGSAQSSLPSVDVVPVPDILYRLPYLHEDRPRGSKAMLDAAGARARLRDVRPGAWLISPLDLARHPARDLVPDLGGSGHAASRRSSIGCAQRSRRNSRDGGGGRRRSRPRTPPAPPQAARAPSTWVAAPR